jgi:hypothetical protein
MNLNRVMFGRINIGSKRHSLGQANLATLLIRMRSILDSARVDSKEVLITVEMSTSALPESSTFSRESQIEQSLASLMITDADEESPFPGITIGRVAEVMSSPEYQGYALVCEPDKRIGVPDSHIELLRTQYQLFAPDCFEHFPRWVDS